MRVGDEKISFQQAQRLIDAYARKYAATIHHYDLAGHADGEVEPSSDPTVSLSDLGRMSVINAGLTGNDAARLLRVDVAWTSVAPTARLEDAEPDEPDGLYAAMTKMWSDVRALPGIGPAKASKLLHIKRPFAFPLLDRDVRKTYKRRYANSREFWREIRADLLDGATDLERIAKELGAADDGNLRRAGKLPSLRLLDILAWMLQQS